MADTGLRSNIQITGVKETITALDAFAPEVKKVLNRQIRSALEVVKRGAEARYPEGAWIIKITKRNLLGSITTKPGSVGDKNWGSADPGVKAAIFEFAENNPSGRPQVAGLLATLNRRYGAPGRFLWAAWDSDGEDALNKIKTAVKKAEAELQARLDATGEEF